MMMSHMSCSFLSSFHLTSPPTLLPSVKRKLEEEEDTKSNKPFKSFYFNDTMISEPVFQILMKSSVITNLTEDGHITAILEPQDQALLLEYLEVLVKKESIPKFLFHKFKDALHEIVKVFDLHRTLNYLDLIDHSDYHRQNFFDFMVILIESNKWMTKKIINFEQLTEFEWESLNKFDEHSHLKYVVPEFDFSYEFIDYVFIGFKISYFEYSAIIFHGLVYIRLNKLNKLKLLPARNMFEIMVHDIHRRNGNLVSEIELYELGGLQYSLSNCIMRYEGSERYFNGAIIFDKVLGPMRYGLGSTFSPDEDVEFGRYVYDQLSSTCRHEVPPPPSRYVDVRALSYCQETQCRRCEGRTLALPCISHGVKIDFERCLDREENDNDILNFALCDECEDTHDNNNHCLNQMEFYSQLFGLRFEERQSNDLLQILVTLDLDPYGSLFMEDCRSMSNYLQFVDPDIKIISDYDAKFVKNMAHITEILTEVRETLFYLSNLG